MKVWRCLAGAGRGNRAGAGAPPAPYGRADHAEQAKRVAAAAEAEARRNNWNVAIAVVDRPDS